MESDLVYGQDVVRKPAGSRQRRVCHQGSRDQTGHTSTEALDYKLLCAQLMVEKATVVKIQHAHVE